MKNINFCLLLLIVLFTFGCNKKTALSEQEILPTAFLEVEIKGERVQFPNFVDGETAGTATYTVVYQREKVDDPCGDLLEFTAVNADFTKKISLTMFNYELWEANFPASFGAEVNRPHQDSYLVLSYEELDASGQSIVKYDGWDNLLDIDTWTDGEEQWISGALTGNVNHRGEHLEIADGKFHIKINRINNIID